MTEQRTGWKPIDVAPETVKVYGPGKAPEPGGSQYQIMMTESGPVALRFGENGLLKYWYQLQDAPE